MNKIIVIGNLGRDPEMRYTPNGQGVTSFSVASSRKYATVAGESREEVEWFNCSAFGKLAENCNQYLTKGKQVYVEGRLSSRCIDHHCCVSKTSWHVQEGYTHNHQLSAQ